MLSSHSPQSSPGLFTTSPARSRENYTTDKNNRQAGLQGVGPPHHQTIRPDVPRCREMDTQPWRDHREARATHYTSLVPKLSPSKQCRQFLHNTRIPHLQRCTVIHTISIVARDELVKRGFLDDPPKCFKQTLLAPKRVPNGPLANKGQQKNNKGDSTRLNQTLLEQKAVDATMVKQALGVGRFIQIIPC